MRCYYCFKRVDAIKPYLLKIHDGLEVYVCPICLSRLAQNLLDEGDYPSARLIARRLLKDGFEHLLSKDLIELAKFSDQKFYYWKKRGKLSKRFSKPIKAIDDDEPLKPLIPYISPLIGLWLSR